MKKFLKQSKSVKLLVIGMIAAVCVAFIAEKKSAVQTVLELPNDSGKKRLIVVFDL